MLNKLIQLQKCTAPILKVACGSNTHNIYKNQQQLKVKYVCMLQSDPTYVPIKFPERSDRSSGTESDENSINRGGVRFSKLAEVGSNYTLRLKNRLTVLLKHKTFLKSSLQEGTPQFINSSSVQNVLSKRTLCAILNNVKNQCHIILFHETLTTFCERLEERVVVLFVKEFTQEGSQPRA